MKWQRLYMWKLIALEDKENLKCRSLRKLTWKPAGDPPRHDERAQATESSVRWKVKRRKVSSKKKGPEGEASMWWTEEPKSWRTSLRNFFPWEKCSFLDNSTGRSIAKLIKVRWEGEPVRSHDQMSSSWRGSQITNGEGKHQRGNNAMNAAWYIHHCTALLAVAQCTCCFFNPSITSTRYIWLFEQFIYSFNTLAAMQASYGVTIIIKHWYNGQIHQ